MTITDLDTRERPDKTEIRNEKERSVKRIWNECIKSDFQRPREKKGRADLYDLLTAHFTAASRSAHPLGVVLVATWSWRKNPTRGAGAFMPTISSPVS
jgi:hypothetical protein